MVSVQEAPLRGKVGGHARAAKYAGADLTAAARRAFLDQFSEQVDPTHSLPPDERERRAKHARKAHMARLALEGARRRRERAEAAEAAELAALAALAVGPDGGAA